MEGSVSIVGRKSSNSVNKKTNKTKQKNHNQTNIFSDFLFVPTVSDRKDLPNFMLQIALFFQTVYKIHRSCLMSNMATPCYRH